MPAQPSFSVAVICRNGSRTLPRLAASLKEFLARGGEWVLVDTGSTDGTPDLARSLGAKVTECGERFMHTIDADLARQINERFTAEGDEPIVQEGSRLFHFAQARNFAAGLCSNDWVSWLDSDEAFTVLDLDKIEEIISDPDLEHVEYDFVFAHAGPYGEPGGDVPTMNFTQSKMYRRSRMEWAGAVHEVVTRYAGPPIPEGAITRRFLPPSVFHLEHWQIEADHRSNYLPGLAWDAWMKLSSDPAGNRDRQWHYLGRELMYFGRHRSAIKLFEEHVKMNGWPAERAQSFVFLGDCWGQLGDGDKQAYCYFCAYHIDPTRRVGLLRLADFYRHHEQWQAALCYAKAALEIPWHGGFYADFRREYEDIPHLHVYAAAGWLGRIGEAQEHLQKVLEHQPWSGEAARDAKYYFGYDIMSAPEGWMMPLEMLWLYGAAQIPNGDICEVGSWKGRSTHALCSGADKAGAEVTAVDHWRGSVGEDAQHAEAKADPDAVYRQFYENTKQFSNLHVRRGASLEIAASTKNECFDLVFLDASHDFDSVVADIRAWRGKVKPGGILCGHDFCDGWPGVQAAVRAELGEPDGVAGSIWWFKV